MSHKHFGDKALLDRLTHHVHILEIIGDLGRRFIAGERFEPTTLLSKSLEYGQARR